jgi:flagellar biosynthesis repressor protein FlbT
MPLTLRLEPRKKIIINGAVIENMGAATSIVVHNTANILKGKDVLTEADATTPARRVYYAAQCAYLFDQGREEYVALFNRLADDYLGAAPSGAPIIAEVRGDLGAGRFYAALKACRKLIEHEAERLALVATAVEIVPAQPPSQ